MLFHQFHQEVSAIKWKPLSNSVLAVACCGGVCLWDTERSLQVLMCLADDLQSTSVFLATPRHRLLSVPSLILQLTRREGA